MRPASPSASTSSTLGEARVAGEPEHEVDPVRFAPGHQALAREARVGPQQDANPRPARPDLDHDACDLLGRARTRIDVGAAQLGGEEMPAAEDVERKIAIRVVVAMEEATLLAPVDGIVRGVEV